MNRSGFKTPGKPLARTGFTSKPKPMKAKSAKKAAYRASEEGKAALQYMGLVKQLPCCVCGAAAPSSAHHCISDNTIRDDLKTIPLCYSCHQGPDGIHAAKRTWESANGKDYDYIEQTRRLVGEKI